MSLLEPEKQSNNLYINPIFDSKQRLCWSADRVLEGKIVALYVAFGTGEVHFSPRSNLYARAVRSLKETPPVTPTVTSQPTPSQKWTDPLTGIKFVWVPEGCFQMGCVSGIDCKDNEKPVHEVCLDGFWMGKYEVTQAQWQQVMGNNPSFKANYGLWGDTSEYPVEKVSWNDVQTFLKKLNSQAGKEMYRLPSEAEWEYATRAGTETTYSFGDDADRLDEYAWYFGNSGQNTHPVGQLKPNAWGLYDMHGNVWEWCEDLYSSDVYKKHQRDNPIYTASDSYRVVRGGSINYGAGHCRAAFRNYFAPDFSWINLGFRLVRTP